MPTLRSSVAASSASPQLISCGATRAGALPESAKALVGGLPNLAFFRPYVTLEGVSGWFDDFGHSGLYDALGGKSRVGTYLSAFAQVDGVLKPIPLSLRNPASERYRAGTQATGDCLRGREISRLLVLY